MEKWFSGRTVRALFESLNEFNIKLDTIYIFLVYVLLSLLKYFIFIMDINLNLETAVNQNFIKKLIYIFPQMQNINNDY